MQAEIPRFELGIGYLQFPNAVLVNAVGHRNMQMSANERKRPQTQVRKRAQKGRKRVFPVNGEIVF